MSNPQVYVAERESSRYVTAFHDHVLYLLENVSGKVSRAAIEAIPERGVAEAFGEKAIIIPASTVTRMITAEHDDTVKLWYDLDGVEKKHVIAMDGHEEQLALMRSIAESIPDAKESAEPVPVWQAIIGPGLTSLGIIAATIVFLVLANDVASGEEIDTSGRRGGTKKLLANVLGAIGPVGVGVIGGLALAGALFWLYKRVKSPPIRTVIERVA